MSRFVLCLGFALFTACLTPTDKPGNDDTGGGGPLDADGDGFSAEDDCNDAEAAINPDAEELCDGVDNDCDGVVDGADATGTQTFYADSDGDGYGDPDAMILGCEAPTGHVEDNTDCDDTDPNLNPESVWFADSDADGYGDPASSTTACVQPSGTLVDNTDCDDSSAGTYPGADEFCDNVDTNCDGTVDDANAVSHEDGAGLWTDETANMSGTASAVAEVTVDGGTYHFCPGTHYVQIEVLSSTVLVGSSGNAADVKISANGEGRVIDVGEGIDLEVRDLQVKDGTIDDDGGNIRCFGSESNPSTLVLYNVLVTDGVVTGNSIGAGLLSYLCDTTLTDSTFSGNQADAGAGIVTFNSNVIVEGCEITANVATDEVGGMAVVGDSFLTTVTITDTRFEDNEAQSGGGAGLYVSETAAVISGTGAGTCVFHGNTASTGEGGAIYLEDATLDVTGCDFGTAGTAGDNSENDIYLDDADRTFDYGEGETFSCDDTNGDLGICTPGTYDIEVSAVTTNLTGDGRLRGNIIDLTSTLTLNSFAMWLDPQAGCNSLDMYLMTSPDLSTWTLQWSDTVSTTTSNAGWQESGAVGVALSSGQYIAAFAGWTCSVTYYYSSIGDLEFPFGTVDGNVSNSSYTGLSATPWAESGWSDGVISNLRYQTTYNVTQ